ncbi:hypothetical protein Q1695_009554 [Nippostrongylus brasiliensis]|nr:hypothetical protein Q1695_009554 [Nippostrongylus brasiliensis]
MENQSIISHLAMKSLFAVLLIIPATFQLNPNSQGRACPPFSRTGDRGELFKQCAEIDNSHSGYWNKFVKAERSTSADSKTKRHYAGRIQTMNKTGGRLVLITQLFNPRQQEKIYGTSEVILGLVCVLCVGLTVIVVSLMILATNNLKRM